MTAYTSTYGHHVVIKALSGL